MIGDNRCMSKITNDNLIAYIDLLLALGEDKVLYGKVLRKALRNVYYRLSIKERMPLYIRLSILNINTDPTAAMYWAERARKDVVYHRHGCYSSVDTILFYCVYTWACIQKGMAAYAIMGIRHVDRCILDNGGMWGHCTTLLGKTKSLMAAITGTGTGTVATIIELSDELVLLSDITSSLSLSAMYEMVATSFKSKPYNGKMYLLHLKDVARHKLYKYIVSAYMELDAPLCGAYERGNPGKLTTCVNEFFAIYSDEPRRYVVKERDIVDIENDYPGVTFCRSTLKFKVYV
jgi:hypothetical protein